jgi:hypothetical protein
MSAISIHKTEFAGWSNCYRITNDKVEVIATTDVGPRIIRYGFIGERNLFAVFGEQAGKSGEPYWQIRGGHRLWIAPEVIPDTYALDNRTVQVTTTEDTLTLRGQIEPETELRKQISITMSAEGAITIAHQIENAGPKSRRFAPWALTVMAPGGVAIAPFPPRGSHGEYLLPTNPLAMWAYTDFSDPRWRFTKKYLLLSSEPGTNTPQKAGIFHPHTFCAYLLGSYVFTKRYTASRTAPYPDFHCSLELFTNHEFLEIETVGPLADVVPGTAISHVEHWSLYRDVSINEFSDAALDGVLQPLIDAGI